jgi:hypothetical protein
VREGAQIEAATQEVVGDLTKYLSGHWSIRFLKYQA